MTDFPKFLYARVIDPGTDNEFLLSGSDLTDVDDSSVSDNQTVSKKVARYKLVGTGEIHQTAPRYVEDVG